MREKTRMLPVKLFGVTVDNVKGLVSIVAALKELKQGFPTAMPIVRIVFDICGFAKE